MYLSNNFTLYDLRAHQSKHCRQTGRQHPGSFQSVSVPEVWAMTSRYPEAQRTGNKEDGSWFYLVNVDGNLVNCDREN